MRIGFTGTRNGLTAAQKASLRELLRSLQSDSLAFEAHHGDCVGADDEFADLCAEVYRCLVHIVCHPPVDDKLRAYNGRANETLPPRTHFARNRDIVAACDLLLACPGVRPLPEHGGTAYTARYGRKVGKPVKIIWPDGSVEDMK